jgi:hypothetical protein
LTCPVLSHLPVRSHVCMRPAVCGALCGPHSRPHARLRWRSRLRLRLSGLLARAWARSVSLPTADFPYPAVRARAFPACPPACSPSRLSLLSGAARSVAPPANRLSSWERVATSWPQKPLSFWQPRDPPVASQTRAPAGFSPATAAQSVTALPMRAPAKSGASDVATGAANPFEIACVSRVGTEYGFFPGSAYTLPLVVLRKHRVMNLHLHDTPGGPSCHDL